MTGRPARSLLQQDQRVKTHARSAEGSRQKSCSRAGSALNSQIQQCTCALMGLDSTGRMLDAAFITLQPVDLWARTFVLAFSRFDSLSELPFTLWRSSNAFAHLVIREVWYVCFKFFRTSPPLSSARRPFGGWRFDVECHPPGLWNDATHCRQSTSTGCQYGRSQQGGAAPCGSDTGARPHHFV